MPSKKSKGPGGRLARSEVVTVRLDPRLRFGAELAARKQRRTVSSFIEWAVEQALAKIQITYAAKPEDSLTAEEVITRIWDVDESDRFILLALCYPELLNHHEQILWKLIVECEGLWKEKYLRDISTANFKLIRKHWDTLSRVVQGDLSESELPAEVLNFKEEASVVDK